jgi:hypothetical protein
VPIATFDGKRWLFDHLVGAGGQRRWNLWAEYLGGGEVDDEIELGRLLDRDVAWLRPAQNFVDQLGGAPLKSMKATVPTGIENSYFS